MNLDFDLIVVGAGIQGAGVAQAAQAAGYRTLVLERDTPASGTSSRSSKLIHGGLRYLEQFSLGLVQESLEERALLTRIAPGLVRLAPFRIPVFRDMRRPAWQIHAGLALYRLLAGPGPGHGFTRQRASDFVDLDGIDPVSVGPVFTYQDGMTDDAALTRAVLASAVALGAQTVMPAAVTHIALDSEWARVRWAGGEARARAVVNTTGAWVNELLRVVEPVQQPLAVDLVRGTHIELPYAPLAASYYVEAPQDGRAVFVMPRAGHVLVGTTEATQSQPWPVEPSPTDIEYLEAVVRTRFPGWSAEQRQVQAAWAGLRVLPTGRGPLGGRSRESLMVSDRRASPRLISVCGGKLTTYRRTALSVVAALRQTLPTRQAVADTADLVIAP